MKIEKILKNNVEIAHITAEEVVINATKVLLI